MESSRRSKSAKAGPKLARKYVEKNRRIYMNYLINQLYSMLPAHASTSKDKVAVPDQVHAAEKYIASLDKKLEKKKKHLEQLKMGSKTTKARPQIEFHEMGPNMIVVLITGLDNLATFDNIIRLCHEEGVEVVYTSFQLNGNSTLQISHETKVQINRSSTIEFRSTTLCGKMKELIYGPSCSNDMESQLHLWDYIIESGLKEFDALELLPTISHMQNVQETPSSLWN
ncbi:transcription factor bHLH162-like [Lycium barbarum]|uniref:transcription factor bHLH162-like n=1 Tax=Lycium barbarum TaxID=112863 RepID=UPI00293EC2FF|nr:transcription factor bHLH162-like [Lycium barbarum]